MFKKLLVLGAMLAATLAVPAQAQAADWYTVSVCGSAACPPDAYPIWFGPYQSWEQCNAAREIWAQGIFGTYPWGMSSCFSY